MKKEFAITHIAREKTELLEIDSPGELKPDELRGKTITSLVSPGTELSCNYLGKKFPNHSGYAAVFKVDEIGNEVKEFNIGDIVFCQKGHQSYQQISTDEAIKVPNGLSPEKAVVARLMNVSMTTLMTTTARPGDKVIISGCGPVGYLAAEIFRVSGYDIIIVEPDEQRRKLAKKNGILQTFSHIPLEDENIHGQIALVVECSGHEQAILDACKAVRRKGEVVMVGVPWRKCTDLTAHVLLWEVFHKYPVLRSGWEWELPIQSSHFSAQSIHSNLIKGLKWLSEGKIHLDNIISLHSPRDCQAVYKGHLLKTHRSLCTVFDWKN